jgi:hypothetical protein
VRIHDDVAFVVEGFTNQPTEDPAWVVSDRRCGSRRFSHSAS